MIRTMVLLSRYYSLSCLFLLLQYPRSAHGQFLWQQVVRSVDENGVAFNSTLFTFAEKPGVQNDTDVDNQYSTMAYDKGVYVYMRGARDDFDPVLQLHPQPIGNNYLAAPLPENTRGYTSYALESYCMWGAVSADNNNDKIAQASSTLLVYYTSASRFDGNDDPAQVIHASRNKFRVDLTFFDTDAERNGNDGNGDGNNACSEDGLSACISARVEYEGMLLTDKEVFLLDGVTGEDITTEKTDQFGQAYFVIPRLPGTKRVFARVSHRIDAPPGSKTKDGVAYDVIENFATSVLELSEAYASAVLSSNLRLAAAGETLPEEERPEGNRDVLLNPVTLVIGVVAIFGSFVGGVVTARMVTQIKLLSQRRYGVAPTQDNEDCNEKMELEGAAPK